MCEIEERELDRLLNMIEEYIDSEHCLEVDERYMKNLQFDEVDRTPLVVQPSFGDKLELPLPWRNFKVFNYRETFESPIAMMQNMLLGRVVPGILLKDDSPLAIRNNHGTIQVASVLGGKWEIHENNYPWIDHLNSIEDIEKLLDNNLSESIINRGILPHSFDTLNFYNEKLDKYPKCKKAIQISLPDLQGPFDTAEQLWGSDIYYAFYENPELLSSVLKRVTDVMLLLEKEFRKYSYDKLESDFNTQHGYVIPGRILIRDDSSIMVSPEMYSEFIRPHDERILQEVKNGSIHFCGNGQHLVKEMLKIPYLKGLDFGQPEQMDISHIYSLCSEKKVAITNLNPKREDIISGKAVRDFPTGAVFVYRTNNFDDAMDVVNRYKALY